MSTTTVNQAYGLQSQPCVQLADCNAIVERVEDNNMGGVPP